MPAGRVEHGVVKPGGKFFADTHDFELVHRKCLDLEMIPQKCIINVATRLARVKMSLPTSRAWTRTTRLDLEMKSIIKDLTRLAQVTMSGWTSSVWTRTVCLDLEKKRIINVLTRPAQVTRVGHQASGQERQTRNRRARRTIGAGCSEARLRTRLSANTHGPASERHTSSGAPINRSTLGKFLQTNSSPTVAVCCSFSAFRHMTLS